MGAWIEIDELDINEYAAQSHSSWVRGLKFYTGIYRRNRSRSHSSWVRGLKLQTSETFLPALPSHSSWVRGLKYVHFLRI